MSFLFFFFSLARANFASCYRSLHSHSRARSHIFVALVVDNAAEKHIQYYIVAIATATKRIKQKKIWIGGASWKTEIISKWIQLSSSVFWALVFFLCATASIDSNTPIQNKLIVLFIYFFLTRERVRALKCAFATSNDDGNRNILKWFIHYAIEIEFIFLLIQFFVLFSNVCNLNAN